MSSGAYRYRIVLRLPVIPKFWMTVDSLYYLVAATALDVFSYTPCFSNILRLWSFVLNQSRPNLDSPSFPQSFILLLDWVRRQILCDLYSHSPAHCFIDCLRQDCFLCHPYSLLFPPLLMVPASYHAQYLPLSWHLWLFSFCFSITVPAISHGSIMTVGTSSCDFVPTNHRPSFHLSYYRNSRCRCCRDRNKEGICYTLLESR